MQGAWSGKMPLMLTDSADYKRNMIGKELGVQEKKALFRSEHCNKYSQHSTYTFTVTAVVETARRHYKTWANKSALNVH